MEDNMKRKTRNNVMKRTAAILCFVFIGILPLLTSGCTIQRDWPVSLTPEPGDRGGEPVKQYIMRQRLWTLGDQFIIKDERRRPVFFVKGKFFSIGDKLSFRDMNGEELAYISQKVLSFKPRYRIFRDGELIAKVVKKITVFKDKYTIDVPGPDDYKVKGNFGDYEYIFTRGGREVAVVSKAFFSLPDTYGIEVVPGEDDILILATAVIIDLVLQHQQEHAYNY
jgi:uncharacterized protein YxjI